MEGFDDFIDGGGSNTSAPMMNPAMAGGFGFTSDMTGGFKPVANTWSFPGGQGLSNSPGGAFEEEDYLDDEERERVLRVQNETDERRRTLFSKQEQEEEKKRDRKAKGREELVKWQNQRAKEVELRKSTNKEGEKMYHEQVDKQRNGPNPWERVTANCEMNGSQYVGGADVSRMRQAMIARKSDITKSGGASKLI